MLQCQHEEKQAWHYVVFFVEERTRVLKKLAADFHAEPWEDMLVQQQGYKRMPLRGINLWFGMWEKRKKKAIFSLKESLLISCYYEKLHVIRCQKKSLNSSFKWLNNFVLFSVPSTIKQYSCHFETMTQIMMPTMWICLWKHSFA